MNDVEVKATNLNRERKFLKAISPHKETSIKFPLKIKHPFHSQHPLTLTDGQRDCNCSVCMKILHGSIYHCFEYNFFLDLNCVLQKTTIKYDCHQEHLLIFLKKNYGKYNKCDACDQDCKASPILRCADCDFNLLIDCFPALPPTFKNPQCHLHTLTLTKSFADDLSADKFYCDFCEDEGDPKLPVYVYYYEECSFFAHVLYEELPSILAKLDSTRKDEGVEESVFVDISNDKIEDEVADEDPVLAKFGAKMRELELKLERLMEKRPQYLVLDLPLSECPVKIVRYHCVVFLDISNDKIEDEVVDEDPTLAKFDAVMRELEAKLEELKQKHAQYLASVS